MKAAQKQHKEEQTLKKKIVNDPKNKHEKSKQDETEIKIFFFKKKDVREND